MYTLKLTSNGKKLSKLTLIAELLLRKWIWCVSIAYLVKFVVLRHDRCFQQIYTIDLYTLFESVKEPFGSNAKFTQ